LALFDVVRCVMDAWLQTEKADQDRAFRGHLVSRPQEATPLTQNEAREAMGVARRDYPEFVWQMESGFKSGEFILHGRKN
jgi:hypothetical protein